MNEISFSAQFRVANGNYQPGVWQIADSYSQNTVGAAAGVMATSTTAATVPSSIVSTLGYCVVKNLDTTNNIDLGVFASGTFTPFGKLKPGEQAVFRLYPGVVFQAKAEAGTPGLSYWILQD